VTVDLIGPEFSFPFFNMRQEVRTDTRNSTRGCFGRPNYYLTFIWSLFDLVTRILIDIAKLVDFGDLLRLCWSTARKNKILVDSLKAFDGNQI